MNRVSAYAILAALLVVALARPELIESAIEHARILVPLVSAIGATAYARKGRSRPPEPIEDDDDVTSAP